jgi:hypothetical protein
MRKKQLSTKKQKKLLNVIRCFNKIFGIIILCFNFKNNDVFFNFLRKAPKILIAFFLRIPESTCQN